VAITLSEEAMKTGDRELLEDLIRSAVNAAMTKVQTQALEASAKMASELGLPAGTGLPGLG
jgi:DNA-binding protein YbaB